MTAHDPDAEHTGRDPVDDILDEVLTRGRTALHESLRDINVLDGRAAVVASRQQVPVPHGAGQARHDDWTTDGDLPISVVVVDADPMWRDGIARDLTERGFEVRATAGDAASALSIARTVRPDVVLMSLSLGDTSEVNAVQRITQRAPDTRVLVLSASGEHSDILEAVKAGASGYVVKSASVDELADAVRRVAAGDALFTAGLAGLVLGEYRRRAINPDPESRTPQLTARETDVLRLVAKGMDLGRIAQNMMIAVRRVDDQLRSVLRKLQLRHQGDVAHYSTQHDPEDEDERLGDQPPSHQQ